MPRRTRPSEIRARNLKALEPFGGWTFADSGYGTFARCDQDVGDYTVRLSVGDDDNPTEWGDYEPTERERRAASSYYAAVQVLDADGEEAYHDGIGGVDAIDLPGHSARDWEDAAAYAFVDYLRSGALKFATNEPAERAHWEARDTITVDA